MKTYRGHAVKGVNDGGPQTVTVSHDGNTRALFHRVRHSPDGFQWGYQGSGPADLARSILWDHTGKEPHPATYQAFKRDIVSQFRSGESWTLGSEEIAAWLRLHDQTPAGWEGGAL